MKILLPFLLLIFFISSKAYTQDTTEVRAVWLTTNFHLDWPSEFRSTEKQKNELVEIFKDIKSKGLNTIYFQVRSGGTVLFDSKFEPPPQYINTNSAGILEYDPSQFAIETAHSLGLKIHAWVNVMRCLSGSENVFATDPNHIVNKYPHWVIEYSEAGNKSYWLDPGLPEVRLYLIDLISELAADYDFDGIHLDFLRYPGKIFDDDFSYYAYGEEKNRGNWRRENLNMFLSELKNKIKYGKPDILIGATPIGVYKNLRGGYALQSYSDSYQDSYHWLKNDLIDYVVPQIYWAVKSKPGFKTVADDWKKNSYGKDLILGIGVFKESVKKDLAEMVQYSRKIGAAGFSLFRYSDIKKLDISKIIAVN